MIGKNNTYKILELFFDYPTRFFQLREISRLTNISLPSVIEHIKLLERLAFVKKQKTNVYDSYKANRTEKFFLYKRNYFLSKLYESGLVEYLEEKITPNVIVLFGSASKGEDIEDSDIDLFILAKEKKVQIKTFEQKLKRNINLFFEEKISDIPAELLNNIVNGIVLSGYLRAIR